MSKLPSPLPSDALCREIVEQMPDAAFVTDSDFVIEWINERACELLGYPAEKLVGHSIPEFFWAPTEIIERPLAREDLLAGRSTVTLRPFRCGNGSRRVLEVSAKRIGDGKLIGIARDATERIEAQEQLARSEESFRTLIEHSPDSIVVHRHGRIVYVNAAFAELLGFENRLAPVGLSPLEVIHPDDRDGVRKRIAMLNEEGAVTVPFTEERLVGPDGRCIIASIAGVRIVFEGEPAIAAIGRDVSEQRLVQSQLAHSEKMASIGLLAAGVAHEINNPLTYVMLRLQAIASLGERFRGELERVHAVLCERIGCEDTAELLDANLGREWLAQLDDHLATALEGTERVCGIVRDLRIFSRADDEARQVLDVHMPLERAVNMSVHELRHRARVVTSFQPVPPVLASEGRLTQVFLNLLLNAGQAIGEGSPERNEIHVSTSFEHDRVCIAIRDTAGGIPAEHLPRLFEPFFTTKPVGIGSGLGLSICHGIIRALGGTIRAESRPGVGSTFVVALPAAATP